MVTKSCLMINELVVRRSNEWRIIIQGGNELLGALRVLFYSNQFCFIVEPWKTCLCPWMLDRFTMKLKQSSCTTYLICYRLIWSYLLPAPGRCNSISSHQQTPWTPGGPGCRSPVSQWWDLSAGHWFVRCSCGWRSPAAACCWAPTAPGDLLCRRWSSRGIFGDRHKSSPSSGSDHSPLKGCFVHSPVGRSWFTKVEEKLLLIRPFFIWVSVKFTCSCQACKKTIQGD